jgi:hypothetical protein
MMKNITLIITNHRRKKKLGTDIGYRNMLLSLGVNFFIDDAEQ